MDSSLKKKLRALSLALRHTLEGTPDQTGDLESRLNQMGVWKDRASKPVEELRLSAPDLAARRVVDAFLIYRAESGVSHSNAFTEFVRESAYTWANRLFMLRCMESRGLIDDVILQKEVYGGRSLAHHRFAQQNPAACSGEDDGLFAVLDEEFRRRTNELPTVFDPNAAAITLRPSVSALKSCVGLLSGTIPLNGQGEASDELFEAPDSPGWAYQFWNAEEKDRIFERLRTEKKAKVEGADLIPATQLYTEPYMVKFLVQNSLGAFWASMYPETKLTGNWEYYVRDADRTAPVHPDPPPFDPNKAPEPSPDPWVRPNPRLFSEAEIVGYARTLSTKVKRGDGVGFIDLRNRLLEATTEPVLANLISLNQEVCAAWDREWPARRTKLKKSAAEITFLDPACGSGHFLLEAFDLLYEMYVEEGLLASPEDICASILNNNLFGIDIDARAIQISVAALWMHSLQRAPRLRPDAVVNLSEHIVTANLSVPQGHAHLETFLTKHPEDAELRNALDAVFRGLADANQLGTLLRIEEPVDLALQKIKQEEDERQVTHIRQSQATLEFMAEQRLLSVPQTRDYGAWKLEVLERLRNHFRTEAAVSDPLQRFFGQNAAQAIRVFEVLARRFDVICANPPYLGHGKCGETIDGCLAGFVGSADLYAAFIERSLELAASHGTVGLLSLSNYLNADDYIGLRAYLLRQCHIQTLVNLSNKTIPDLSNPNAVYFCMAIFSKLANEDKTIRAFDLEGTDFDEKQPMLLRCLSGEESERCSYTKQAAFKKLPGSPIAFKLPPWAQIAYEHERYVKNVADARQGLITGDNDRFLRFRWECPPSARWVRYAKGGAFRRWAGNDEWVVDWERNGARIRHFADSDGNLRSRPQNIQYFGQDGCSWSSQTVSVFAVRRLEPESAFDSTGSSAFPIEGVASTEQLMAVFNTPAFALLYSIIQPGIHFREGYLQDLPYPPALSELDLTDVVQKCIRLQVQLQSTLMISEGFSIHDAPRIAMQSFASCIESMVAEQIVLQIQLHETECLVWDCVESAFEIPRHQQTTHLRFSAEGLAVDEIENAFISTLETARSSPAVSPCRATQNKVEEALAVLGCHPKHVGKAITDGLKDGLGRRLLKERRAQAEALISAAVLSALGHQWPHNTADAQLSVAADADGVLVVNDGQGGAPLLKHLSEYLAAEFTPAWANEFEALAGTPASRWLIRDFFQAHMTLFRGRPIAWMVGTQSSGQNTSPVFTSLLYYQKLHGVLPILRTRYVWGLRTSFESELRTIGALSQPTTDQLARKEKLAAWIEELKQFQETLENTEALGFFTEELRPYAIVDAVQSLTRQWLARLRQELRDLALSDWQSKAVNIDLHADFPSWISIAVDHVARHCVAVAPDCPPSDTNDDMIGATTIAELFRGRALSMIRAALNGICREWQSQFDEALIQPLREQTKAVEAEFKELQDNIDNKLRRKDLKSKAKLLKREMATLVAKSKTLADQMCDWRCPEAESWIEWLGTQPLYDEFTSLDGTRPAPQTVVEFVNQESLYAPDINDGVRVNIAPLQKGGILARDVLVAKDVDKAIADRAEWRADERRWCRQGILPRPGWWPEAADRAEGLAGQEDENVA